MRILTGQDAFVAQWASNQVGRQFQQPFVAFGVIDDKNALRGAVIWHEHYRQGNIEMTVVGRGCWRKGIIQHCFRYAFSQCSRITARTRRGNVIARRLLPKLGFAFEFTQKRFFGPNREDDGLVFVLFRENAEKWI